MSDIHKILVGLAFEGFSEEVLDAATDMARCFDADLVVVNVIDVQGVEALSTVESMGYAFDTKAYIRDMKAERARFLDELIKANGFPKDRVKSIFVVGRPVNELLDLIRDEDVDLVVIGAKGPASHPQLLVGEVAEKIVRHAPVTVVVVKHPPHE